MVILILFYLFSLDYGFWKYALILGFIHLLIDVLKSILQRKAAIKETTLFFFDQLLHIIVLVLIAIFYQFNSGINFILDIPLKYLAIAAGFTLCSKPANIIVKNIFDSYNIKIPTQSDDQVHDEDTDLPNAGKLIGIMERFLVLALILVNQYSAVGLIIAAKSILRFRDNKKNEYILIGTMLSFGIATLVGIVISYISVK